MAFAEEQRTSFLTIGGFDPHMVLAVARTKPDARVGEQVEVHTESRWYKARIIDANPKAATYKVHYYGWEATDDEWVTASQLRTAHLHSIGDW